MFDILDDFILLFQKIRNPEILVYIIFFIFFIIAFVRKIFSFSYQTKIEVDGEGVNVFLGSKKGKKIKREKIEKVTFKLFKNPKYNYEANNKKPYVGMTFAFSNGKNYTYFYPYEKARSFYMDLKSNGYTAYDFPDETDEPASKEYWKQAMGNKWVGSSEDSLEGSLRFKKNMWHFLLILIFILFFSGIFTTVFKIMKDLV